MTAPIAQLDISTRRNQRISAVPFAECTIVHVRAGTKHVGDDRRHAGIDAGDYLAVAPGQLLNVQNWLPDDGLYIAVCLAVTRGLLSHFDTIPGNQPSRWAALPASASLDQAFSHAEQGLADKLSASLLQHRVAELVTAVALSGFRPQYDRTISMQERLRLLLAAEPAREWKADEVARRLAVSSATLRRQLANSGCSFRATLLEVRLAHALALIQSSDKPLQHIAEECGYTSTSHFSRRFRARYGCTPSTLRH